MPQVDIVTYFIVNTSLFIIFWILFSILYVAVSYTKHAICTSYIFKKTIIAKTLTSVRSNAEMLDNSSKGNILEDLSITETKKYSTKTNISTTAQNENKINKTNMGFLFLWKLNKEELLQPFQTVYNIMGVIWDSIDIPSLPLVFLCQFTAIYWIILVVNLLPSNKPLKAQSWSIILGLILITCYKKSYTLFYIVKLLKILSVAMYINYTYFFSMIFCITYLILWVLTINWLLDFKKNTKIMLIVVFLLILAVCNITGIPELLYIVKTIVVWLFADADFLIMYFYLLFGIKIFVWIEENYKLTAKTEIYISSVYSTIIWFFYIDFSKIWIIDWVNQLHPIFTSFLDISIKFFSYPTAIKAIDLWKILYDASKKNIITYFNDYSQTTNNLVYKLFGVIQQNYSTKYNYISTNSDNWIINSIKITKTLKIKVPYRDTFNDKYIFYTKLLKCKNLETFTVLENTKLDLKTGLQSVQFSFNLNTITTYSLILIALVSLLIALPRILSNENFNIEKKSAYECGFEPFFINSSSVEVHYLIVAFIFLIFDMELLFLTMKILYIGTLGDFGIILFCIYTLTIIIMIYTEWKNGALSWPIWLTFTSKVEEKDKFFSIKKNISNNVDKINNKINYRINFSKITPNFWDLKSSFSLVYSKNNFIILDNKNNYADSKTTIYNDTQKIELKKVNSIYRIELRDKWFYFKFTENIFKKITQFSIKYKIYLVDTIIIKENGYVLNNTKKSELFEYKKCNLNTTIFIIKYNHYYTQNMYVKYNFEKTTIHTKIIYYFLDVFVIFFQKFKIYLIEFIKNIIRNYIVNTFNIFIEKQTYIFCKKFEIKENKKKKIIIIFIKKYIFNNETKIWWTASFLYNTILALLVVCVTGHLLTSYVVPQTDGNINTMVYFHAKPEYSKNDWEYVENLRWFHSKATSYLFINLYCYLFLFFSTKRYIIYDKTFSYSVFCTIVCLFVAFTGFVLPWGHNGWFVHHGATHTQENLFFWAEENRHKRIWYVWVEKTFYIYTKYIYIVYWSHYILPYLIWFLIITHYRAWWKEPIGLYTGFKIIWLKEPGKSIDETEQLVRLREVFAYHHPIQIIRMSLAWTLFYLYIKYFPDPLFYSNNVFAYCQFYTLEYQQVYHKKYEFVWYLQPYIALLEVFPNRHLAFWVLTYYFYFWLEVPILRKNKRMLYTPKPCQLNLIILVISWFFFVCFLVSYHNSGIPSLRIIYFGIHFIFLKIFVNKYWGIYSKLRNESYFDWFDRIVLGEVENYIFNNFIIDYTPWEIFCIIYAIVVFLFLFYDVTIDIIKIKDS